MWNYKAACKEIAELDALKEHFIHREKLKKIKPRIDNRPPKPMTHVHNKTKKEFEELKIQADIQYNNQLLLKKLQKIEKSSYKPHVYSQQSSSNRLRIDELIKIGDENQRILSRIQSARPYYPTQKLKEDYLNKKYLSLQLSENARRIPRTTSFNPSEMNEVISKFQTSRPTTATASSKKLYRPMSARQV